MDFKSLEHILREDLYTGIAFNILNMEFNYAKGPSSYYMPTEPIGSGVGTIGGSDSERNNLNAPSGFATEADIEKPLMSAGQIGTTVTEIAGQQDLLRASEAAIKFGVKKIELAAQQGGPTQPTGPESYGKEAREAMRDIARVNEVEFTSVHTPTNVGNMSGFNPQQGFIDEQRKQAVEEVQKAINFAAEVAGGGAVVVHTGEFNRPIENAKFARKKKPDGTYEYDFLGYQEEPGRSNTYMVDKRTGKIVDDIKKSKIIREPLFKTAADFKKEGKEVGKRHDGTEMNDNDWVTLDGRYIDPTNEAELFERVPEWDSEKKQFKTKALAWEDVEKRTDWYNSTLNQDKQITPEMMAFKINITNQILQAKGSSLFYGRYYDDAVKTRDKVKEALKYYEKLEAELGDDAWKLEKDEGIRSHVSSLGLVPSESKLPSQILKDALAQSNMEMKHIHEASAAADARAMELQDTLRHTQEVEKYALSQSEKSYAEAGIMAMKESKQNPHAKRDIFVAPENIFTEQYGSHPDELIDIVTRSRKKMVEYLTEKQIEDPHARIDSEGSLKKVENPYYNPNMSKEEAEKMAERHIKATLDTEHLAMWRKKFQPKPGETLDQTNKRFIGWWEDQIKKLGDSGIIGHVHMVDSMDGSHGHIPAGQGNLPLVGAIKYLKDKDPNITVVSEGHSENRRFGLDRQITSAWRAFGVNIRGGDSPFGQGGGFGAPYRFDEVHNSYFNRMQSPYFIFGTYAPSNDWTLWSQVPLE